MLAQPLISPLISVNALMDLLKESSRSIVIFDVRYALSDPSLGISLYQAGHLPQAIFADLDKELSGEPTGTNGRHPLPDRAQLAERLRSFGMDNDSHVIIYDQGGDMYAPHLWWLMLWMGHQRVQVLDGGYSAWQAAGGEVTTSITPQKRGGFIQQPSVVEVLEVDDVLRLLHSDEMTLIDARAPERFSGEVEMLDPVAGHIPGALNYPMGLNLDANGFYKDAQTLRMEWLTFLDGRPVESVVQHCGSGVSACHNLLAMAYAGLGVTKLYRGSWSEWVADATRPVATL